MKHIVIYNDKINNKAFDDLYAFMKQTFESQNYDYELIASESCTHTAEIINQQQTPCRLYICGGDGTLHNCIKNIIHSQHELVLLPFGTGNDFSRMLVDQKDAKAHFSNSFKQKAQLIDVMKINDTYGINTACFGFDADIANHVHEIDLPFSPRSLIYLITALKRVFAYKSNQVCIKVDGKVWYEGKIFFATINNGKYYGGGYKFTPKASVNDGILDLFIIKDFKRIKVLYKIFPILIQKPWILKDTITTSGKCIEVISKQGVNIDGETYSDKTFKIEAITNALRFVNAFINE